MEFTNDTDLSEIRSMLNEHMRENYPLSQKSFELWYSYLKLVYLDTEKAVFACDTEIKRKVLTNNHLDFIKKCVLDVIGYSPEIEIKVDPSVAPPNPYSHNLFMEQLQSRADTSAEESADSLRAGCWIARRGSWTASWTISRTVVSTCSVAVRSALSERSG